MNAIGFVFLAGVSVAAGIWTYGEQENWADEYPECGGMKQSPILINITGQEQDRYSQMFFTEGFFQDRVWRIRDEFHFFEVVFDPDVEGQATPLYDMEITGGPLGDEVYIFDRIWLKLSPDKNFGVEHKIYKENRKHPQLGTGEFQVVFIKKGMANYEEALQSKPDGLFIIGINVHEDNTPIADSGLQSNFPLLRHIFRAAKRLQRPGKHYETSYVNVIMRIGDLFNDLLFWYDYTLYDGSLTHPPCTESVKWMVLWETVNINDNHIDFINQPMIDLGPRASQPLNGRAIENVDIRDLDGVQF